MRNFLDEYITTLSAKQRINIYSLLSEARASKTDLDLIAKKLSDTKQNAPIILNRESFGSIISERSFHAANRDITNKLLELFANANRISLLLESHTSILSSEIKGIEDEIMAMEKSISNYAFTLSDGGFYDYAFTETFNDETMREESSLRLTDRSGNDFQSNELAAVNSASGVLSLRQSLKNQYPISAEIINSNCLQFVTSNTGIDKALNTDVGNGWRIAVSSPKPITSKIDNTFGKAGAQVELEILLNSISSCDSLVLTPFSDLVVDVMQVVLFVNDNNKTETVSILNEPLKLDKTTVLGFELRPISKVKIILNQSVYFRGEIPPIQQEIVYRKVSEEVKKNKNEVAIYTDNSFKRNKKALKRLFIKSQKKQKNVKIFKSEIPEIDFDASFGPLTIDKIIMGYDSNNPKKDFINSKSQINHFMSRMIDENIFASNTEMLRDRHIFNANPFFMRTNSPYQSTMVSGNARPAQIDLSPQQPLSADLIAYAKLQEEKFLDYQYNLGLRNIQIGSGERVFRGIFVSKKVPAPSDSGEVKIKVDDTNYIFEGRGRDTSLITSIEYSVSNKSNPSKESDWVPILPIDESMVNGERLFIDEAGSGTFRFEADINKSVRIYKNGFLLESSNFDIIKNVSNNTIKGIQIRPGFFNNLDLFTIDYEPSSTCKIVNFEDLGFGQSLLASAFDDYGAGETFTSTYNNQIIDLKNDPFVDYTKIEEFGSYSSQYGFQGTYQPITIIMNDGSVALNQTNYKGLIQNSLSDFSETQTAFVHSGRSIAFNKPISEKFTVFYQYLPNNLRFRIILRVNDNTYVSPSVNYVQLKTKTLKANPRKII